MARLRGPGGCPWDHEQTLESLQEKTRGNLIEPEERLVDDLLYELRLRFVQAQQGDKRTVEP